MYKWLSLALLVLIIDQASKAYIVSTLAYLERVPVTAFFQWVHWTNPGAAFSFLADAGGWQKWLFVSLAAGFSVYLVWEIARLPREEKVLGWVFGLILGGALGNLTDRLYRGEVVDFIYFHYQQWGFPAFNVADSSLFCGAVLWIFLMIKEYRQERSRERAQEQP